MHTSYEVPHRGREGMLAEALIGALAGAAAVWAMDRVDWFNYTHEAPSARHRTEAVRPGGMAPAQVAASRAAHAIGQELSPGQLEVLGGAVHYGLGIGPAAFYPVLCERFPVVGAGRGALFGLGLFLLEDELLNPVMGLAAKPQAYPWQAHARGLVAHLVYGLVTDAVTRVLKSATGPGRVSSEGLTQGMPQQEMATHVGLHEGSEVPANSLRP